MNTFTTPMVTSPCGIRSKGPVSDASYSYVFFPDDRERYHSHKVTRMTILPNDHKMKMVNS